MFDDARLTGACDGKAHDVTLLDVWPNSELVNFWVPLQGQSYMGALVGAMRAFLL